MKMRARGRSSSEIMHKYHNGTPLSLVDREALNSEIAALRKGASIISSVTRFTNASTCRKMELILEKPPFNPPWRAGVACPNDDDI